MYELAYIPLNKLLQTTPVLKYDNNNSEGLQQAIRLYGARPAIINRATHRLMTNPAELEALAAIRGDGQPLPAAIGTDWSVPTLLGEWDERSEQKAAITINGGFEGLLLGIPTLDSIFPTLMSYNPSNFEDVTALGVDLLHFQHILDTLAGSPPADEPPQLATGAPTWEIPQLDPHLQGRRITTLSKWGSKARSRRASGETYHFYADDVKFRALIDDSTHLTASGCSSIIEPNFSTDPGTPRALVIGNIYHKRAIARRAQDAGIRVFVDLNIEQRFFDLALLGVPTGWTAYANRGYARDVQHISAAYELAAQHAQTSDINYVVYGGGRAVQQLCSANGWHWFQDEATAAHG